jgi:hypothetical protein
MEAGELDDGLAAMNDWRQYFTNEELTEAYEKIQSGDDPNEDEVLEENGSESCPSDGNLDLKDLYSAIYCEKKKAKDDIANKEMAETQYEQNFANFVKKVSKKIRGASKDSNASEHQHKELHSNCEKCRSLERKKLTGIMLETPSLDVPKNKKNLLGGRKSPDIEEAKRQGKNFIISKRSSQDQKGGKVVGISDVLKKAMNIR